jgi:hypothetical protein
MQQHIRGLFWKLAEQMTWPGSVFAGLWSAAGWMSAAIRAGDPPY